MTGDSPRFVAEGHHHRPVVDELERVLDRYEDARRLATHDEETEQLEAREQFRLDWGAVREHGLRSTLEEVAWLLERRGHRAWIEPPAHAEAAADVVAGARAAEPSEPLEPLVFRFVAAHVTDPDDAAAGIRFVPDPDRGRIDVDGWYPGEWATPTPLAHGLGIDDLSELQVVALVTRLIGSVLLEGLPPVPDRPPPPRRAVPAEDRQWADTTLLRPEGDAAGAP